MRHQVSLISCVRRKFDQNEGERSASAVGWFGRPVTCSVSLSLCRVADPSTFNPAEMVAQQIVFEWRCQSTLPIFPGRWSPAQNSSTNSDCETFPERCVRKFLRAKNGTFRGGKLRAACRRSVARCRSACKTAFFRHFSRDRKRKNGNQVGWVTTDNRLRYQSDRQ